MLFNKALKTTATQKLSYFFLLIYRHATAEMLLIVMWKHKCETFIAWAHLSESQYRILRFLTGYMIGLVYNEWKRLSYEICVAQVLRDLVVKRQESDSTEKRKYTKQTNANHINM